MHSMKETQGENLDAEWVALILKAKQIGLSAAEIRNFLKQDVIKKKQASLLKETEPPKKHLVQIKKDFLF